VWIRKGEKDVYFLLLNAFFQRKLSTFLTLTVEHFNFKAFDTVTFTNTCGNYMWFKWLWQIQNWGKKTSFQLKRWGEHKKKKIFDREKKPCQITKIQPFFCSYKIFIGVITFNVKNIFSQIDKFCQASSTFFGNSFYP